jgi:hypothetical protein
MAGTLAVADGLLPMASKLWCPQELCRWPIGSVERVN